MKCDRFIGTGMPSNRFLKATISNTADYQSSSTSSRRHASKQKSTVDHHSYKNDFARSNTVTYSGKGSSIAKAKSLRIDNFPETYTTKNNKKEFYACAKPVKNHVVITKFNGSN